MRLAFSVILVVLIALGAAEFRRWTTPEFADTVTQRQKWRRGAILGVLVLVDALIIGGTFMPLNGHLPPKTAARELLYWAAVLLVFLVVLVALFIESAATRRREALRDAAGERDVAYKELIASAARAEQKIVERQERPMRNGHG